MCRCFNVLKFSRFIAQPYIMSMLGWLVNEKFKKDLVGNFVT